jgi:lipopolysaccharide transport system ATP-binding protein
MSDIAIRTDCLSKRYQIGAYKNSQNLREAIKDAIKSPFRRAAKLLHGQATGAAELDETFWALREVSFEIKKGEAVGIIGRNGAGKSTLLKVLSRITEPTSGKAEVQGRVGSLLEVGTGFHHELTGRENIFLNGAILGMKREHIRRKFDEIVAFSEVEKFIDTPVKHYSSGMYLRLAFSVAAHLDPDVLIIDEVLAVGDAAFQRKCLNQMQKVEEIGKTVIFVSHNMPAITRFCTRALVIDQGRIVDDAPAAEAVMRYLGTEGSENLGGKVWNDERTAPSGSHARLLGVRICSELAETLHSVDIRRSFGIEATWEVTRDGLSMAPHFLITNQENQRVFVTIDLDPNWRGKDRPKGKYMSTAWVPGNLMAEGIFYVTVHILGHQDQSLQLSVHSALSFQVVDTLDGDSARGDYGKDFPGIVRPLLKWTTNYFPSETHKSA